MNIPASGIEAEGPRSRSELGAKPEEPGPSAAREAPASTSLDTLINAIERPEEVNELVAKAFADDGATPGAA